jgi:hypothetical protein
MNYLRQLCGIMVLLSACACSIYAGEIECTGLPAAGGPQTTTAGEMSTTLASDGQISTGVTAAGKIDCGVTATMARLIESLLSLS